jgi:hypothetical protein
MACSGLAYERDPLPDVAAWRDLADSRERLRVGLRAIFDWYERNDALMACVLRDAEHHALTREIGALWFTPSATAWQEVLDATLSTKQRATLRLALSFFTWRTPGARMWPRAACCRRSNGPNDRLRG